jgi:hypothetical protein
MGYKRLTMPQPRPPHPRLVQSVTPLLGGVRPDQVFVAQVGGNPAVAIAALPLGVVSLLVPTSTAVGLWIAIILSAAFVAWVLSVYIPMKSRVVAVTRNDIAVFDSTKLTFRPKSELRRLPRSHRFGEVKGLLTGKVDLGDGEQGWVYKGYAGTIDLIDERHQAKLLSESVGVGLPPRQRLSGWFRRDR